MTCSSICAGTVGAITASTIIGGCIILSTPILFNNFRRQPETQDEIVNKLGMVIITAAIVGASLGILVKKTASFAYQIIAGR